ncbi:MAG: Crp/Fnr family transcriptional regulator [Treponema sp.]|nr:Crp/Fnr family transcriptional regulator [Treponema sp.]
MPKVVQYTKGSIIYFTGDKDDRIYILQSGHIVLTSIDIETNAPISEQTAQGEFFGVKSALGHFPRQETATAITDCVIIVMPASEFESIFITNQQIIYKMLRVFSGQLRKVHRKIASLLHTKGEADPQTGMLILAKSFYDDEQYRSCCDVCLKLLLRFPNTPNKAEATKLYNDAKLHHDKLQKRGEVAPDMAIPTTGIMKQFTLPAFDRFAKTYEPGQVIISEFEPGDCFYLIQAGEVQLIKSVNGSKKNLDILKPGDFFGEMAILDNSPRSATCMAIGKVKCLEFNKENFQLLIMNNPQIALILLKMFCKRIYDQQRRLHILVLKDNQARVGDVFLLFDEMNQTQNPPNHSRKFNLTISDVASWAGLSPEDTKNEINHFVEKNKLDVYDNYMFIHDIEEIRRIVETRSAIKY